MKEIEKEIDIEMVREREQPRSAYNALAIFFVANALYADQCRGENSDIDMEHAKGCPR